MQTSNRLFDDLARVASGAFNTLSGLREEIETRVRERVERMAAELDLVTREEFDAVRRDGGQGTRWSRRRWRRGWPSSRPSWPRRQGSAHAAPAKAAGARAKAARTRPKRRGADPTRSLERLWALTLLL